MIEMTKVETMMIFLPNLSARTDSSINPVTLPTNSAERIELRIHSLSQ